MTVKYILRNISFFFVLFLNKLFEAIVKRKLPHSMGISKFMVPGLLGHSDFLYRIYTSGVRNSF